MWCCFAKRPLLTGAELDRIRAAIAELEVHTAAEIRVSIQRKRAWNQRGVSLSQLAEREFRRMGMQTTNRLGILAYFLVSERACYLLADSGVYQKIGQASLDAQVKKLTSSVSLLGLCAALISFVQDLTPFLQKHFPPDHGPRNELPDTPVLS